MPIWSAEIKELEKLSESLKGQLPDLEKELALLIRTDDPNVIMLYSRRCLEVIITDLCICELKRARGTEPLKGIIDKLRKEDKVPLNIITSMDHLNGLSAFGTHPKDFDPEQVKPVLNNLDIIIKWYYKFKITGTSIKLKLDKEISMEHISTKGASMTLTIPNKRLVSLLSGFILLFATVFTALFLFKIIGSDIKINEIEKSIAVLPIKLLSNAQDKQWLADGMTDEIRTNLSKIKAFSLVRCPISIEQYKEINKSLRDIGQELGVEYVLKSSLQIYDSDVRLTVQLFRSKKENLVWANEYKGKWNEVFSAYSSIAQTIANELRTIITPEEKKEIEKELTKDKEALRLYLVGNFLVYQQTEESFQKAIENYLQAISLDSSFARAYAGLANAYLENAGWTVSAPSSEFIAKATESTLKALEIDKDLGEGYFMLGRIYYEHNWDWFGAEKAFKKGMELSPDFVYGRLCLSNLLTAMGRFKESIAIGQRTLEIDPLDPVVYNELAFAMHQNGQYNEALELYNLSLNINPDFVQTIILLGSLYSTIGNYNQAITYWERFLKIHNYDFQKADGLFLAIAGTSYLKAGRRDEALNILENLKMRLAKDDNGANIWLSVLYNALGDKEKAIEYLENGYKKRELQMVWINSFLFINDPIRSDVRFNELLRDMRFPKNN